MDSEKLRPQCVKDGCKQTGIHRRTPSGWAMFFLCPCVLQQGTKMIRILKGLHQLR